MKRGAGGGGRSWVGLVRASTRRHTRQNGGGIVVVEWWCNGSTVVA